MAIVEQIKSQLKFPRYLVLSFDWEKRKFFIIVGHDTLEKAIFDMKRWVDDEMELPGSYYILDTKTGIITTYEVSDEKGGDKNADLSKVR